MSIIGDPLRLNQILVNLCDNAVKFNDVGGEILVSVVTQEEDETSTLLHFSVCDTGIGMTIQEQSGVFHAFNQVDSSSSRKYGGTGLGLSISKNLTEMLGGEIWVESKPKVGSTFQFTLRFEKQQNNGKQIWTIPQDLKKLNILLVDDNTRSRAILSEMLTGFGFSVHHTENGKKAIVLLEKMRIDDPYQLLLVDWKMPGMDGIDTVRTIQESTVITPIPAILMAAAHEIESARQAAKDVDSAAFLSKPVLPASLLNTILSAIR